MTDSLTFENELRAALGDAYDLERELTGSGMSRVFVATERALNRKVVIKVLPPELAAGVNRERFRREIQLAAQLQHPHIVPLHAAGAKGDLLFFTMPFIEGESLRHAILSHVRFSVRDAVRILHDVADALAYAHARGVIHRDIKPGNVLRSGSHAMVTDFGVAKAISAAMPTVTTTSSGMAIGTPAYMAPEQLAGDPSADHRVDIYALGLLAYELLSGDAPFKAPSPQETMAAQLTRVPEPVTRHRDDVPPVLATLVSKCLAKNPNDRPQTAAEVVATLDELELSSGSGTSYRAPQRSRSRLAMAVGAGALLVAMVVWRSQAARNAATPVTPVAVRDTTPVRTATLTHDDSLAIARAVEKKLQQQEAVARARADSVRRTQAAAAPQKAAPSVADFAQQLTRMADSIRSAVERSVLDSVARYRGMPPGRLGQRFVIVDSLGRGFRDAARAGREGIPVPPGVQVIPERPRRANPLSEEAFAARLANLGPPRRLFVSYPTQSKSRAFAAPATDSLVDSLRRAIARNRRFVLIASDSVREALAATRNINEISKSLDVDLFASVYLNVLPDSSVVWTLQLRDLTAHSAFGNRAVAGRASSNALMAGADSLVSAALRYLQEMDRAPRRTAGPGSGGEGRN